MAFSYPLMTCSNLNLPADPPPPAPSRPGRSTPPMSCERLSCPIRTCFIRPPEICSSLSLPRARPLPGPVAHTAHQLLSTSKTALLTPLSRCLGTPPARTRFSARLPSGIPEPKAPSRSSCLESHFGSTGTSCRQDVKLDYLYNQSPGNLDYDPANPEEVKNYTAEHKRPGELARSVRAALPDQDLRADWGLIRVSAKKMVASPMGLTTGTSVTKAVRVVL